VAISSLRTLPLLLSRRNRALRPCYTFSPRDPRLHVFRRAITFSPTSLNRHSSIPRPTRSLRNLVPPLLRFRQLTLLRVTTALFSRTSLNFPSLARTFLCGASIQPFSPLVREGVEVCFGFIFTVLRRTFLLLSFAHNRQSARYPSPLPVFYASICYESPQILVYSLVCPSDEQDKGAES